MDGKSLTLKYYKLLNERNLTHVALLFHESATYSSNNTGVYFGKKDIIKMIDSFYNEFPQLHWIFHAIKTINDNIAEIDLTLYATDEGGNKIQRSNIETVVTENDYIRHIEVRNKLLCSSQ